AEVNSHTRMYKQQRAQREQAETQKNGTWLLRDNTFPPSDWDPQQVVMQSCTALKELLADRSNRFRRKQEPLVDTSNTLPFGANQSSALDLEELCNILTLDLEQREMPWKGTVKTPGFTSVQLASRLPLLIKDPAAEGGPVIMESELLPANDLHMIRLDIQPGQ
ncbi:unnamed protein product, partial [Polarella glacialis]